MPGAARNMHLTGPMHRGGGRTVEEMRMRKRTWFGTTLVALLALGAFVLPAPVDAGCGCSKPPPPRAAVRPFVGYADQKIILFSELLAPDTAYWVQFTATADGSTDWSRGKAALRRDFADGQARVQMRVSVGNVALGPCSITVWADRTTPLYTLGDDQFTVTSKPIVLHDFTETVTQEGYQAGVGKDGTVYVPVDVSSVSDGTIFSGMANGFPLSFEARSVAMYNQQGFLMQLLDPTSPGLFRITRGGAVCARAPAVGLGVARVGGAGAAARGGATAARRAGVHVRRALRMRLSLGDRPMACAGDGSLLRPRPSARSRGRVALRRRLLGSGIRPLLCGSGDPAPPGAVARGSPGRARPLG